MPQLIEVNGNIKEFETINSGAVKVARCERLGTYMFGSSRTNQTHPEDHCFEFQFALFSETKEEKQCSFKDLD